MLFLGLGLTSLFGASYVQAIAPTFDRWAMPVLSDIPFIGPIFFDQDPLVYISYVLVPVVWWVIYRTAGACSCGPPASAPRCSPPTATACGRAVHRRRDRRRRWPASAARTCRSRTPTRGSRTWCKGAASSPSPSSCSPPCTPVKVAAGAYLFGAALALAPALQARGYGINQFALDAMPYVVTLLVLDRDRPQAGHRDTRGPLQGLRHRTGVLNPTPSHHPPHPPTHVHGKGTHVNTQPRRLLGFAVAAVIPLAALAACGSDDSGSSDTTAAAGTATTAAGASAAPDGDGPGTGGDKIGFIMVGPKDDYGYNQAAYEGSQAVAEAIPDMEVITAENVPESDEATRVMEDMIDRGAKIIFATSLRPPRPGAEGRRGPPRRRRRPAGQLHPGRRRRRTSAPTSAPCTSRCTSPASPPVRRPSRTSSATSTPSRSRRRSPTSTPSSSAPSR